MRLVVPEQTEVIQQTLACLESIRLNESGRAFHTAVQVEPSPGVPSLFLSESGIQVLDEDVGLLVLSARPRYLDAEKLALFGVR